MMKIKHFSMIVKSLLICGLLQFALANDVTAQEEETPFSFSVSLNSDQFFGFYPFFQGAYSMSDQMDFTFYGIL